MQQARQAETELDKTKRGKNRDRGALHGIPVSLKDNIYTKDIRTTGGSKILKEFIPLHDAPVVASLKKAGAVLLGKTNMHEFAYGVTTNNPHFGPTRNPWDLQRIPGGSSGGSAAALAAGLCYGSLGSDTGGSIRIPASLCGIVGLKPGLGRVNTEDVIPLSPTLDCVGPMARTVKDTAVLLEPILLPGARERKLRPERLSSPRARRPCLGLPKELFLEILDPEVEAVFETALQTLKKRGAKLREVSFPQLQETEDAGNQIAWAEATLYHQQAGWFPLRAAEYGEDVRERLEIGTRVSAVSYLQAQEFREKLKAIFHDTLLENGIGVLAVPTTPITAPKIGQESVTVNHTSHLTRALLLRTNRPANLLGVPAISVPAGLTRSGLPVGIQFIADWTDEALLLELASSLERECPLTARPNLDLID